MSQTKSRIGEFDPQISIGCSDLYPTLSKEVEV